MTELVGKGKPFHSGLDKAATLLKRKVGTGAEFMKELMSLPGIKQTEIQERGLGDVMGAPKMTHEQFMAMLGSKPAPAIHEKVLGKISDSEFFQKANEIAKDYYGVPYGKLNHEEQMKVESDINENTAHHQGLTLPGGENYREMLIKAPEAKDLFEGVGAHFGGERGILASMRLKDRKGPNGEKLLHVEEIQSDWHQKGREKGYKDVDPEKGDHLDEQREQIKQKFDELNKHRWDLWGRAKREPDATPEFLRLMEEANSITPILEEMHSQVENIKKQILIQDQGVPNAPFKKNWEEMALKRLIHHAAEKGYHGIVVTPGKEQADRYSLAKHINELHFSGSNLTAYDHNGQKVINKTGVTQDELPSLIGKEASEKLLAQKPQGTLRSLTGQSLEVGGEGMKGFYDKKVPNILNTIGKKYGVKTELHGHPIKKPSANNSNNLTLPGQTARPAPTTQLHHFPITEDMRKDVLTNGLPLYKEGGIIHKAIGGNVQPSLSQMKFEMSQRFNPLDIQNVGANEAPNMSPKAYVNPLNNNRNSFVPPGGVATPNGMPIGGIDQNQSQPGQQLAPQQLGQPQMGQQGQPQQGQQDQSGAPPQHPQQQMGNMLSLTPQGQAMNAMGGGSPPQQLAIGGMATGGKLDGYASKGKVTKSQQTVKNAQRMAYPGIYGDPKEIAALAASRVASEDPILKQLFGVTRADMYQQSHGRQGMPHLGMLPGASANPRGSEATEGVMNKRNEQRLLDVMSEAGKHQSLVHGMDPWYYMDPLFNHMVKLLGMQKATEEYKKMNALMGMASSSSEVNTEIPRGSLAYYLQNQGRFDEFVQHGGKRDPNRPADFGDVPGHLAHKTAHALPMKNFLTHGSVTMESPKVPMYIEASGVPATGFQTRTPVGDAHWSRAVGLADTRNPRTVKGVEVVPGASVSTPEMSQLGPWWQHKIASKLGLESVPAQARAWGAFSPQTGVTTPIGAPKLELIAKQIGLTAKRLGVTPETARDMVLTGKERMGMKKGGKVKIHKDKDTMTLELMQRKKAK